MNNRICCFVYIIYYDNICKQINIIIYKANAIYVILTKLIPNIYIYI